MPLLLHGARPAPRRRGGRGRDGPVRRPDRRARLRLDRARRPADPQPRWCWCSTSRGRRGPSPPVVHGLRTFDPDVRIAGVILNKAGSARHAAEVGARSSDRPVLGVLPRDAGVEAPSRHLGLVPAAERAEAAARARPAGRQIARARRPRPRCWRSPHGAGPAAIGTAVGPVATWSTALGAESPVERTTGRWSRWPAGGLHLPLRRDRRAARARPGCELVIFDPLTDPRAAGGHGRDLPRRRLPRGARRRAGRQRVAARRELAAAIAAGVPTVAECAGLLYLCRTSTASRWSARSTPTAAMTRAADAALPHGDRDHRHPARRRRATGDRARVPPHRGDAGDR